MIRTTSTARALLLLTGLLGACASTPFEAERPFPYTEFGADGPLESVRPVDLLVAPVHNQSGIPNVPVEPFRVALTEELVARLYSPLSLEWADGRAVEAGYDPNAPGADAILQVVVTRWDESLYDSHGAVLAEAEARLLDAGVATRPVLWAVDVGRRLEASSRQRGRLPASEVRARMADQLAQEILRLLPERNPLAD